MRTAPEPAIIGGSTKKHGSDQVYPVSRMPATSTAALTANVPAKWTTYLAKSLRPPVLACSPTPIDETVVVAMDPDSRRQRFMSSVLTPVLRDRHPDCGNTC
ncbi:MAG: hypothetical protein WAO15_10225 [Mycobacterium sp.]